VTIPHPPSNKNELRRLMRALLKEANANPVAICDALDQFLHRFSQPQTIACYSALPGEVDLARLPAIHPQHQWVYPRVSGENLSFHRVSNSSTDLVPGAYGISEPAEWLEKINIHQIDLFLCPGLAFDAHGGRLGRGKGFYDRALTLSRSDTKKVGVCYPFQRVADTFGDDHDIRMDLIIDGTHSNPGT
jgi:5-formyltetrahydrofolate cyclo-ligase